MSTTNYTCPHCRTTLEWSRRRMLLGTILGGLAGVFIILGTPLIREQGFSFLVSVILMILLSIVMTLFIFYLVPGQIQKKRQ